jgi:hypothetical protein
VGELKLEGRIRNAEIGVQGIKTRDTWSSQRGVGSLVWYLQNEMIIGEIKRDWNESPLSIAIIGMAATFIVGLVIGTR